MRGNRHREILGDMQGRVEGRKIPEARSGVGSNIRTEMESMIVLTTPLACSS